MGSERQSEKMKIICDEKVRQRKERERKLNKERERIRIRKRDE
jgi:hypothetical protein